MLNTNLLIYTSKYDEIIYMLKLYQSQPSHFTLLFLKQNDSVCIIQLKLLQQLKWPRQLFYGILCTDKFQIWYYTWSMELIFKNFNISIWLGL